MIFFFFQAEDGIRDGRVTGVQTCALPIWFGLLDGRTITTTHNSNYANFDVGWVNREIARLTRPKELTRRIDEDRSEERRVGKECRSRRSSLLYETCVVRARQT